jgi:glycosyltransferase involved in cell wall biosynthesis
MYKNPVEITVIICTYNGAERLRAVVDSVKAQNYDDHKFEVLIVDNNSADKTREVCDDMIKNLSCKNIRYFLEKNRGLSHARNRGIREARGTIVAFIDDDASADANWLLNIERIFSDASCSAIGGKVIPVFEKPRPPWLYPGIDTALTILDLGDQITRFQYPFNGPCGTNMAFRKSVFDKVGYFDPELGRIGKKLLSAEESDFFQRLELQGFDAVYAPDCIVYHLVPNERMTKSWIRRRFYYQGYSFAFLALKHNSFIHVLYQDIRSLLKKTAVDGDDPGTTHTSAGKGFFYYEVKLILYCTYLFFLVFHSGKKVLNV